jgi:hypothetical protein
MGIYVPRLVGLFGFAGFLSFFPNYNLFYVLFLFFLFFLYPKPKLGQGSIFSNEQWIKNISKACSVAFFVFLTPSILNVVLLRAGNLYLTETYIIPIVALLSLVASFIYFDLTGE